MALARRAGPLSLVVRRPFRGRLPIPCGLRHPRRGAGVLAFRRHHRRAHWERGRRLHPRKQLAKQAMGRVRVHGRLADRLALPPVTEMAAAAQAIEGYEPGSRLPTPRADDELGESMERQERPPDECRRVLTLV